MSPSTFSHLIEGLETRRLLAATFDVGQLTGYAFPDADWSYAYRYSTRTNLISGVDSGSGELALSANRAGTGAKRKFTLAATSTTSAGTSTQVFKSDASGLSILRFRTDLGPAVLTVDFAGVRLAPNKVKPGRTYADTGTYTGSLAGTFENASVRGSASGNASASLRVGNVQTVTVPAGTFDAVKCVQTVSIAGTMRLTINGSGTSANFTANLSSTVWAVPNVGIVRQADSIKLTASLPSQTATITLTANSRLTSYDLHPLVLSARAPATSIFATRPLPA